MFGTLKEYGTCECHIPIFRVSADGWRYLGERIDNELLRLHEKDCDKDIENAPSVVLKQATGKLADKDIARVSALKDTMKDAEIKLDRPRGEWEMCEDEDGKYGVCSICGQEESDREVLGSEVEE